MLCPIPLSLQKPCTPGVTDSVFNEETGSERSCNDSWGAAPRWHSWGENPLSNDRYPNISTPLYCLIIQCIQRWGDRRASCGRVRQGNVVGGGERLRFRVPGLRSSGAFWPQTRGKRNCTQTFESLLVSQRERWLDGEIGWIE